MMSSGSVRMRSTSNLISERAVQVPGQVTSWMPETLEWLLWLVCNCATPQRPRTSNLGRQVLTLLSPWVSITVEPMSREKSSQS